MVDSCGRIGWLSPMIPAMRATPNLWRLCAGLPRGAADALGSDASVLRYSLEGRFLWPLFENRVVTAAHGLVEWVDGSELPFFELSALGGAETLRGFGAGRFLDKGCLLLKCRGAHQGLAVRLREGAHDMELALLRTWVRCFIASRSRVREGASGAGRRPVPPPSPEPRLAQGGKMTV